MKLSNRLFIPAVLLILVFIASLKLWKPDFYTSHDGEGHVIRMMEYDKGLRDGQFPVRIAGRVNWGLGYPFFTFNYPLPYMIGEIYHMLGFSFVWSFKLLFVTSLCLTVLSLFFWTKLYMQRAAALLVSAFGVLAPYTLLNIYVRGDMAESLGLGMLCFCFYVTDLVFRKKASFYILTISLSLLLLSHNITAAIGIFLLAFYIIGSLRFKRLPMKNGIQFLAAFVFALGITSFFWIPMLVELPLTRLTELRSDYDLFFPTFREIIYSPWGFGGFKQGLYPGKLSPQIGLLHICILIASGIFVLYKRIVRSIDKKDAIISILAASCLFSIFFMLPYSAPMWKALSFLQFIQIPWRLLGYTVIGISLISGLLISKIRTNSVRYAVIFILITGLLYANRNHIRINQSVKFHDPFVNGIYSLSTTSKDEHMPKWAPRIYDPVYPDGDFTPSDSGVSKRVRFQSNLHTFIVESSKSAFFRDNTSYFPGWVATIDGIKVPIEYMNDPYGRLRIPVPKGIHTVIFKYSETWYRLVADGISVFSICLLVYFLLSHLTQGKNVSQRS